MNWQPEQQAVIISRSSPSLISKITGCKFQGLEGSLIFPSEGFIVAYDRYRSYKASHVTEQKSFDENGGQN